MNKVILLEKEKGQTWSQTEINLLIIARVEVQGMNSIPHRLVAMNRPLNGRAFTRILGHSNFTTREVDFQDRWKP